MTDSPYRQPMSESILQLQEQGVLTRMKDKWWKEKRGGGACAVRVFPFRAFPENSLSPRKPSSFLTWSSLFFFRNKSFQWNLLWQEFKQVGCAFCYLILWTFLTLKCLLENVSRSGWRCRQRRCSTISLGKRRWCVHCPRCWISHGRRLCFHGNACRRLDYIP